MIMGKLDEVSERGVLEEKENIFLLEERAGDVWEDKVNCHFCSFSPL